MARVSITGSGVEGSTAVLRLLIVWVVFWIACFAGAINHGVIPILKPTICRKHLIEVLEYVPNDILFILETNGILLDKEYVKKLTSFKHHLHVRVSLKGVTAEQFEYVTAMDGEFYELPFDALKYLIDVGISCNAAIMQELLDEDNFQILIKKLKDIDDNLARDLELESLIMYPFIEQELARRKLNINFKPE